MQHTHIEQTPTKPRSILIDNIFVFAMLVVVASHSNVVDSYKSLWLFNWTNSFQIPLFFCISGYLFHLTDTGSIAATSFLKKKIVRLLIPLIVLTTVGFVLKAVVGSEAGRPVELTLSSYLHSYLYLHDNPVIFLWFLTVLFEVHLLTFLLYRITAKRKCFRQWLIALAPVGPILYYILPHTDLLGLSATLLFSGFFFCGILFNHHETEIIRSLRLDKASMMILLGALSATLPCLDLPQCFDLLNAACGILFSICLMLQLQKRDIRFFPQLRRYTYTIYLLSWFPQSCIHTLVMPRLDVSLWPLVSMLSFVSALLIPYGIGLFTDKFIRNGPIARFVRIVIGLP